MIVRAPIVTIVAGPDWRDRIDVYGPDQRVVLVEVRRIET